MLLLIMEKIKLFEGENMFYNEPTTYINRRKIELMLRQRWHLTGTNEVLSAIVQDLGEKYYKLENDNFIEIKTPVICSIYTSN
jgi:hypothetical protein